MKKLIVATLCCITVLGSSTSAFAMEKKSFVPSGASITRGSSYTYVDLGTTTDKFSSHHVKVTVAAIAAGITASCTLDPKAAAAAASAVYAVWDTFSDGTVYYTVKAHTTQVFLDGEFSHYIIETDVYAYSDSKRKELQAHTHHEGTSLSPYSIDETVNI